MTIPEMLGQSALLTLLGMAVVFSFIIILVIFMNLLHGLVRAFKLDKDLTEKPAVKMKAAPAATPAADTGAVIAAIAAAVHEKQSQ